MTRFVTLSIAMTLSLSAWGDPRDTLKLLFEEHFAGCMKPLNRNTKLYHYFSTSWNEPTVATAEGRLRIASEQIQMRMGYFWIAGGKDNGRMLAGAGLYVGFEPYSFQRYGNTILQLRVKEDANYLPTRCPDPNGDRRAKINSVLRELGDSALDTSLDSPSRIFRRMLDGYQRRQLAQAVFRALTDLRIVAWEYSYESDLYRLCETSSETSAMVVVGRRLSPDTNHVDLSLFDIKVLRQDIKTDSAEESQDLSLAIKTRDYISHRANRYYRNAHHDVEQSLDSANMTMDELRRVRRDTLNCRPEVK